MNNNELRYKVILSGHGGTLASVHSNDPWHPSDWMTCRGDKISVFDKITQEWLPDYYIDRSGE
jgi:hypothetical protein